MWMWTNGRSSAAVAVRSGCQDQLCSVGHAAVGPSILTGGHRGRIVTTVVRPGCRWWAGGGHYRPMSQRRFGWSAPVAALVVLLLVAAPAWASTVQIQDDAHVLNATVVQNTAATLPVGIEIWTTTQDAASKSAFDTDVRTKVSATFPVVMGINTQSRHESIQIGSRAGISRDAAVAVESNANSAFVASMHSRPDYTAAVTAALDSLRSGLAGASRARVPVRPAPAHSSGGGAGVLLILLLIGAIVVVALWVGRRRRPGSWMRGSSMVGGSPPPDPYRGSYQDSGPYGGPGSPPYRSGMGAGAAGAIGAVGGGLLGYELGKMHGEDQQFRRDEMMAERDRDYDSAQQDDWVVGQDSDFSDGGSADGGPAGDGSGNGGDW